jgi:hypothetical protein
MSLRGTVGTGLLVMALVVPLRAQAALEWKLKDGEKFYVDTTTETKQTVKVGDKTVSTTSTYRTVSEFAVTKVEAGAVTLQRTFKDVTLKSDGPASDTAARFAGRLKNTSYRFTITPKGKVTKVDAGEFLRTFGGIFTEDGLKSELGLLFGFLPDDDEAKKQTWERDESLSIGWGTLKGKATYADKGKEISVTRSWAFTPSKSGFDGTTITKDTIKVEQATGRITFDADAGRLVSLDTTVHVKGTLTTSDADKKERTAEVDETTTTTTRLSSKNPLDEKK